MPTLPTRILIVEDNVADVLMLRRAFSCLPDWKTELEVIEDGQSAMDYVLDTERQTRPQLAILDLNFPKYSGLEILHAIRKAEHTRLLPVIIFSSSPQEAIREQVRHVHLTASCYVTKPSDLDRFLNLAAHSRKCYHSARSLNA